MIVANFMNVDTKHELHLAWANDRLANVQISILESKATAELSRR